MYTSERRRWALNVLFNPKYDKATVANLKSNQSIIKEAFIETFPAKGYDFQLEQYYGDTHLDEAEKPNRPLILKTSLLKKFDILHPGFSFFGLPIPSPSLDSGGNLKTLTLKDYALKFIRWPQNKTLRYLYIAFSPIVISLIVTLNVINILLTSAQNAFKLFTTFLPRIIELKSMEGVNQLAGYRASKNSVIKGLAYFGSGICAFSYGIAKIIRVITAPIVAPITSARQAWAIHPSLGILSGLYSVAAYLALGTHFIPLAFKGIMDVFPKSAQLLNPLINKIAPIGHKILDGSSNLVGHALSDLESAVGLLAVANGIKELAGYAQRALTRKFNKVEPKVKLDDDQSEDEAKEQDDPKTTTTKATTNLYSRFSSSPINDTEGPSNASEREKAPKSRRKPRCCCPSFFPHSRKVVKPPATPPPLQIQQISFPPPS